MPALVFLRPLSRKAPILGHLAHRLRYRLSGEHVLSGLGKVPLSRMQVHFHGLNLGVTSEDLSRGRYAQIQVPVAQGLMADL